MDNTQKYLNKKQDKTNGNLCNFWQEKNFIKLTTNCIARFWYLLFQQVCVLKTGRADRFCKETTCQVHRLRTFASAALSSWNFIPLLTGLVSKKPSSNLCSSRIS